MHIAELTKRARWPDGHRAFFVAHFASDVLTKLSNKEYL